MSIVYHAPLAPTYDTFHRQAAVRQLPQSQPLRPYLKRGSPLAFVSTIASVSFGKPKQSSTGDSSDDEGSAPLLSAEAEALLGVRATTSVDEHIQKEPASFNKPGSECLAERVSKADTHQRFQPKEANRVVLPSAIRSGSPRIVRLSGSPASFTNLRRRSSTSSIQEGSPRVTSIRTNLITPAPRQKRAHTQVDTNGSIGDVYSDGKPVSGKANDLLEQDAVSNGEPISFQETGAQMGSLTINRNKPDETAGRGSIRIKRVGAVTGRYLSGPARRGIIRRHSDEEQSPLQDLATSSTDRQPFLESGETKQRETLEDKKPSELPVNDSRKLGSLDPALHVRSSSHSRYLSNIELNPPEQNKDTKNAKLSSSSASSVSNGSSGKRIQPVFKVPPLPTLPSRHDQENEPPPTFKRNKPNGLDLLEKPRKITIMQDEKMLADTPATASPSRKPLAVRSQNTPLRPAPPPPKMSVLDTVTATAGAASASQAKKKRNYISVNGKLFTRMDCIGRGGSSKVYRVMAENYKVFALKRVSLEDVDELAIRGYKGEIELLRKLENQERVIRLYDYEMNDERQTLSILMEMGESDLSRVLNLRLNAENAVFDISFTRYFWKEMLECVQAVHKYDIVHSDLKPANFVLVQGRLKLIDFGIANAIQDDTVNVHREQTIGTPNYMSPEALIDSNAVSGLPSTVGKVMKLGKPSDVWSLGCILYQMVYGKPPFAHITNQLQRVMAIPDNNHVIHFPGTGVGGATVPTGLVLTMRNCLNRSTVRRPTVDQLLVTGDPFLHPDTQIARTVPVNEELIGRLQHSIIKHIQERGMPSEAELSTWPARYFASIKAAVEEGRA